MPHGCLGRNVEVKEQPELHLGGDDGWQLEQRRAGDRAQIEIERRGGERLAAHVREGGGRDPCVGRVELALGGKRDDHVGGVEAGREGVGGVAVAAGNQNPGATGVRRREQRRHAIRDAVRETGVDSFEAISAVARRLRAAGRSARARCSCRFRRDLRRPTPSRSATRGRSCHSRTSLFTSRMRSPPRGRGEIQAHHAAIDRSAQ